MDNYNESKNTWRIPVSWEVCGVVVVSADTLSEAIEIAEDKEGIIPLPEGDYVDGSWRLTHENTEEVRELYNDNQPDVIR